MRPLLTTLVVVLATPALAASQPAISDDLQQEAMSCIGEAAQICPDVWTAEDHGLSCLLGKRRQFSPRCRIVYDKVARVLGGTVKTSWDELIMRRPHAHERSVPRARRDTEQKAGADYAPAARAAIDALPALLRSPPEITDLIYENLSSNIKHIR